MGIIEHIDGMTYAKGNTEHLARGAFIKPKSELIVAVDFDNTLVDWVTETKCIAKKGAGAALKALQDRGCRIVIHTSRVGIALEDGTLTQTVEQIQQILEEFEIPFDSIYLGKKLVADAYIDDRAIAYRDNWDECLKQTISLVFAKR